MTSLHQLNAFDCTIKSRRDGQVLNAKRASNYIFVAYITFAMNEHNNLVKMYKFPHQVID